MPGVLLLGCPLVGGVHSLGMSAYGKCPPVGGVPLQELSACRRCLGVATYLECMNRRPLIGVFIGTYGECPFMGVVPVAGGATGLGS